MWWSVEYSLLKIFDSCSFILLVNLCYSPAQGCGLAFVTGSQATSHTTQPPSSETLSWINYVIFPSNCFFFFFFFVRLTARTPKDSSSWILSDKETLISEPGVVYTNLQRSARLGGSLHSGKYKTGFRHGFTCCSFVSSLLPPRLLRPFLLPLHAVSDGLWLRLVLLHASAGLLLLRGVLHPPREHQRASRHPCKAGLGRDGGISGGGSESVHA